MGEAGTWDGLGGEVGCCSWEGVRCMCIWGRKRWDCFAVRTQYVALFDFLCLSLLVGLSRLFNRFSIVLYTTITNFVFLPLLSLQNHLLTVCKIVVVVQFFLSVFCMIWYVTPSLCSTISCCRIEYFLPLGASATPSDSAGVHSA